LHRVDKHFEAAAAAVAVEAEQTSASVPEAVHTRFVLAVEQAVQEVVIRPELASVIASSLYRAYILS